MSPTEESSRFRKLQDYVEVLFLCSIASTQRYIDKGNLFWRTPQQCKEKDDTNYRQSSTLDKGLGLYFRISPMHDHNRINLTTRHQVLPKVQCTFL
jgi:hypothetical protein